MKQKHRDIITNTLQCCSTQNKISTADITLKLNDIGIKTIVMKNETSFNFIITHNHNITYDKWISTKHRYYTIILLRCVAIE